jgi:tetratricopeptide (TPR) repeat protein
VSSGLFQFVEKIGLYAVGLKVIEQYDFSRAYRHSTDEVGKPYMGERARPLQTLVWYPAEPTDTKPMTVGDYGDLWATETSFGKPGMSTYASDWLVAMSPTLGMSLWAIRNATTAVGRFPVVIYAPSFSAMSWENADLCEYLASHGYVVIASPSMGTTTRGMTRDLSGISSQARDISFLVGFAQTLTNADFSRVAVIGFSWGGISNLFAAARDNRIHALVALDGSMRAYPGLVMQAGDVCPHHMTLPLLYFAQRNLTLEELDRHLTEHEKHGANVLNAWTHGDFIDVHMFRLAHSEFSSMHQRNEEVWKNLNYAWPPMKADYEREDGITGYAWMAHYTLKFLDAYLNHDGVAMAFLKKTPAENGVPKHVMAVNYRAAAGVPASFEGFRTEIGRRGFDQIGDIYESMQRKRPDFKLAESAVEAWYEELIDNNHLSEAIALLKLNVQIYPASSAAHTMLGHAYQRGGHTQLAIESYQRALERDPMNADSRKNLKELGGGGTWCS